MPDGTIPRRIQRDKQVPAERLIGAAMLAVEQMPHADPLLTDAVVLLQQARDKVADFIDRDFPDANTYEAPSDAINPYIVRDALRDLAQKYDPDSGFGREAVKALAQWEALHPETVFGGTHATN